MLDVIMTLAIGAAVLAARQFRPPSIEGIEQFIITSSAPYTAACFKTLVFFGIINFIFLLIFLLFLVGTPVRCFWDENCKQFEHEVIPGDLLLSVHALPIVPICMWAMEKIQHYNHLLNTNLERVYGMTDGQERPTRAPLMIERIQRIIASSPWDEEDLYEAEEPWDPDTKEPFNAEEWVLEKPVEIFMDTVTGGVQEISPESPQDVEELLQEKPKTNVINIIEKVQEVIAASIMEELRLLRLRPGLELWRWWTWLTGGNWGLFREPSFPWLVPIELDELDEIDDEVVD